MSLIIVPLLVLIVAVLALFIQQTHAQRRGPIVVVDRRTYRAARRLYTEFAERGDLTGQHVTLAAMRVWLRRQASSGSARHRARYTARLEWVNQQLVEVLREAAR